MSDNTSYEEIKERLMRQSTDAAATANVIAFNPHLDPWPGDTYVLRELAGVPVEIAVLGRDPENGNVQVVPVDDYPQIGCHDVELHLERGRVANIRCDLDAWVDASRLTKGRRTGFLPNDSLGEIQRKRDAIASGDVRLSLHEEEVEGDPEYRRWKDETLRGVLRSLERPVERERMRPRRRMRALGQIAAAVVLVVGGAFGFLRMQEQIETQELIVKGLESSRAELNEQLTAARQERDRLQQQLSSGNADVSELTQALSESKQRVAELKSRVEKLNPKAVQPNLPFAFMNYGTGVERRGEHTLVVPQAAVRVAMVVEVVDAEPYSHYGLRIVDRHTKEVVWEHERLQREGSLLSLGLPASVLPPGDYDFVISGYKEAGATPLDETYLLHVERPR